ncbi:MAG: DivIVA domain-containing protein, partial [Vicinamibacterales bacterium]|nr:DivIVA domain-containing protein [Vicinamibacterales bacterium]
RLRQDVSRLAGQLAEHQEHERSLRITLLTAQRLEDEIKENAQRQAATVLKEAESRASLVLEKAQARLEDVQREIDGLRLKRRDAETAVESVIGNLKNTLEFIREQDARDDRADKVVMHRPRHTEGREAMQGWSQTRSGDAAEEPEVAVAR